MKPHNGKHGDICPVARVAELLGDECTLLIIRDLLAGDKRFGEIAESLSPTSTRTITIKLKTLEEKGIVTRSEFKERPPRVEYSLTKEGKKLGALVDEMRAYGKRYL